MSLLLLPRLAEAFPLVYVANRNSSDLSVIETTTQAVVDTLSAATHPVSVTVSPAGRYVFVASSGATGDDDVGTLLVIDSTARTVLATVPLGKSPQAVALSRDGRYAYVTNAGLPAAADGTLTIVDVAVAIAGGGAMAVLASEPAADDPVGVALTPDGRSAYITNSAFGSGGVVLVMDTVRVRAEPSGGEALLATIPVGNEPAGIAITPDGGKAYVANFGFASNSVSVIDTATNTVADTIKVGSRPAGVAVSPAGHLAYVTNFISDSVSIIDTRSNVVVATVPVGPAPQGIAVTPSGQQVYVANRHSLSISIPGTVSVFDTSVALTNPDPAAAVLATIDVGDNPTALAIGRSPLTALIIAIFTNVVPLDGDVNGDQRVTAADLTALLPQI